MNYLDAGFACGRDTGAEKEAFGAVALGSDFAEHGGGEKEVLHVHDDQRGLGGGDGHWHGRCRESDAVAGGRISRG